MATEWYIIYTKNNCHVCKLAIDLLQVYGQDYYEFSIDEDSYAKEFVENNKLKLPYIFLEEDHIGSYFKLKDHIRNRWKHSNGRKEQTGDKPVEKLGYKIPGGQRLTGNESSDRRRGDFNKGVEAK